ncbi:MAG: arginine--tRNA ligase [Bacteroidetes bacterium]|nr:arginine--tRNA ligase [Bacteroidota bacterium]
MIQEILKNHIANAFKSVYQIDVDSQSIALENTKPDFEGDYTFVVFAYLKISKKNPEQTANDIGTYLVENAREIQSFNVIKGFLNIVVSEVYWLDFLQSNYQNTCYGLGAKTNQKILVEYSSPNTNKPLHLGHVRNNLLGFSVAEILKANGHEVYTCNLVNDRGIHICKSMLAWIQQGNGETPASSGMKGDHLVGKYYVAFDKTYKEEVKALMAEGKSEEYAEKNAPSILAAQQLLQKWEAGDEETVGIWRTMNGWVYEGFDVTYKKLGVKFDKFYYESNTYLLGKEIVQEGLEKGAFYKKEDGSVWIDLTADGLDHKLLLRGDGTSVYITQDIGTAELKYEDFACERSIYVVGNEQDYHFKVLQLICKKLYKSYAEGIYHLSYGMVELPHGKMKSREGTVVDADDLIDGMLQTAEETTKALGKTYFLLKVDPKKKMMFNPEESIDFQGNTGPFIQYTHARIKSILRNASSIDFENVNSSKISLHKAEKELIFLAFQYAEVIKDAGREMSPGVICNYVYEVAKSFSSFYHECPILKESNEEQKKLRLQICNMTAYIIKSGFALLGIQVPERM